MIPHKLMLHCEYCSYEEDIQTVPEDMIECPDCGMYLYVRVKGDESINWVMIGVITACLLIWIFACFGGFFIWDNWIRDTI